MLLPWLHVDAAVSDCPWPCTVISVVLEEQAKFRSRLTLTRHCIMVRFNSADLRCLRHFPQPILVVFRGVPKKNTFTPIHGDGVSALVIGKYGTVRFVGARTAYYKMHLFAHGHASVLSTINQDMLRWNCCPGRVCSKSTYIPPYTQSISIYGGDTSVCTANTGNYENTVISDNFLPLGKNLPQRWCSNRFFCVSTPGWLPYAQRTSGSLTVLRVSTV